jgi:hypothetical protein
VAQAHPEIISWKNYPTVVYENRKPAVLEKNSPLKLPFSVSTSKNDMFDFKINFFDHITVYPDSRLQILEFTNEVGFVPDLYFLGGKIRFNSSFRSVNKGDNSVILKTPFFELKLTEPADFIVELNMQQPSVEIKMIKGSLPLEFFSYERKLLLTAGQSVIFKGEHNTEKAGIKYDYLLNKRKVPKGTLSEVQPFDQTLFLKQEQEAALKEIEAKKAAEKERIDKIRRQKAIEDSFLCKKPYGQKDQCAWRIENSVCYRMRCNVNGQWGDRTERPIGKFCKKQFVVEQCDY